MDYRPRIVDDELNLNMRTFGAVQIKGPKGCGKTTTAKQFAKTVIEFQDEDLRDRYLQISEDRPSRLLKGEKPILFDEWQDAPKIWGAVRKDVDDTGLTGQYLLTGSSSKQIQTAHSGTLRIASMRMYPMSLFESGDSNGTVSLKAAFDGGLDDGLMRSDTDLDSLISAICRGGWPRAVNLEDRDAKLNVARQLLVQTCEYDVSSIDGVRRDPVIAEMILRSYSRNICQLADLKTIYADASSEKSISYTTFNEYIGALERLYIIDDVDAWNPAIRSKTAIRSTKKKNLVDPSIAVAALGLSPEYFDRDFNTLGFLFESMVMRDLRIYSSKLGGRLSYYHDRYGLEADGVLHLRDGRYAIIEVKLGESGIKDGISNLNKIEELILEHNTAHDGTRIRPPDIKMVITGEEVGYIRDDGVMVIPAGCLRD